MSEQTPNIDVPRDGPFLVKGLEKLTVDDDIGICCHAGECVHRSPEAFFSWDGDEHISEPDKEERDKIIATIRACPSGSLAYKLNGELHDRFFDEPEIYVEKDGPLNIRGGIDFNNSVIRVAGSGNGDPFQ